MWVGRKKEGKKRKGGDCFLPCDTMLKVHISLHIFSVTSAVANFNFLVAFDLALNRLKHIISICRK